MKKWMVIKVIACLAGILAAFVACSPNNKPIEPGDKIGDFTITTGVQGNFTYGFDVYCSDLTNTNEYSCTATTGEAV